MVNVKRLRNGAGVEFYAATEPNADSFYSQFTAAQVERNPAKFHIVESAVAESILRESFHEHNLGPGWVKVRESRPMKSRITEQDTHAAHSQQFRERLCEAFQCLGYTPREAQIASRVNESVMVDAWDIVMGADREAAKLARQNTPVVDPREMELLKTLKGVGRK